MNRFTSLLSRALTRTRAPMMAFTLIGLCATPASAKPIIFDNDMAIDDWAALLYLAQHPSAELKAITVTGSGETHCGPGLTNTAALLDLAQAPNVPFSCGSEHPLDGYFVFPEAWRTDSDTLSGVSLPASARTADSRSAVELIHATLASTDEPVTIIATGPLTNIAEWIKAYPNDSNRVKELVIMGGNLDKPGNIIVPLFTKDHPNTKAEWNIFIDPLAAQIVFDSDLPITLVGLDVTNSVKVTPDYARDFKKIATSRPAKFWDQVLDKNDWFIESGEYYFWDTLSVIIAMEDNYCEGESVGIRVAAQIDSTPYLGTSDLTIPATRADGSPRHHLNAANAGVMTRADDRPPAFVCTSTRPAAVFEHFNSIINLKR